MWNQEKTLQLIENIHCTTCLWDVTSGDYKNKNKKKDALEHIAKSFAVTAYEIDKKVHMLKSQFRREHKKLQDAKKNGNLLKKCSWFGYEPLLFLLRGKEVRGTQNTDDIKTDEFLLSDDNQNDTVDELEENGEKKDNISTGSSDFRTPKLLPKKRMSKEALQCMKALVDRVLQRDDFSVYGEHVGNKLRSCGRTDFEIAVAQNRIDNILFGLTMGRYYREVNRLNDENPAPFPASPASSHQWMSDPPTPTVIMNDVP